MADPCFPALAPPGGAGSFRFWEKDPARVAQEIVEGRPFQVFDTERGRFDAMLDFMLRSGLWAAATGMRPSHLKKDNGIRYPLLHGVECLREMAGRDTPAHCGPLLKDPYLLERIGFTAEKIHRCLAEDRTVIDPESLLNPLGRFTEKDLEAGFLQHLEVIRHKRWLRGGMYAVEGPDSVIPHGPGYEGARRISDGSYGYKLLVLLNIQSDCELIVGYVLGGLQESEITMLRRLLARLQHTQGPLREWLKILLLDRGYWGTDLFCELQSGLRHRFREPGAGREVRPQRPHPTATGRNRSKLDGMGGATPVRGTQGDAEGAHHGAAAHHLDQRRDSRSPSNRGAYRGGHSIPPGGLPHPGQARQGHLADRLHYQSGPGEVWGESAELLSGSLGNRESRFSIAVADLGHRSSGRA